MVDIEFKYIDKSLYIKDYKSLVLSDVHFGYKDPNSTLPKLEYDSVISRINNILNDYTIENIIFNGDIFSHKPHIEDLKRFESINDKVSNLIFIRGNHEERNDGYPEYLNKYTIRDYYELNNIQISHGHKTPVSKSNIHIMGHIHPRHNDNSVLLYGKNVYYMSDVIILPAFSDYVSGNLITKDTDYSGHCPIIADGKSISEYSIYESDCTI